MSDHHDDDDDGGERLRREQREATDRFIGSTRSALTRLEVLTNELNRARELDADVRALLPSGETGETIRVWLDGHDRIADELQLATDELTEALRDVTEHAAATEVYLQSLHPGTDDPRG
ncbi:MAG: hypothetical protein M3P40_05270 [Actinomycetota bacterium]|nr:hypothetical protein [Actinomycetota bacterium]